MDIAKNTEGKELVDQIASLIAGLIAGRIGRTVIIRDRKTGWSYYSPLNFAFAKWRRQKKYLIIDVKEHWAIVAGVAAFADAGKPNGWHGGVPNKIWYVRKGDIEKKKRIAGYLSKVCEARHRCKKVQPRDL